MYPLVSQIIKKTNSDWKFKSYWKQNKQKVYSPYVLWCLIAVNKAITKRKYGKWEGKQTHVDDMQKNKEKVSQIMPVWNGRFQNQQEK